MTKEGRRKPQLIKSEINKIRHKTTNTNETQRIIKE
jgi:hypothetical protein